MDRELELDTDTLLAGLTPRTELINSNWESTPSFSAVL